MNLRTLGLMLAVLTLAVGCSERPLRPLNPCTISGVTSKLGSNVNEVDMLFMVDTSRSMLEEQALLRSALPELVNALVAGRSPSDQTACDALGPDCRRFRPVKSLRVGVITSDIGTIANASNCVNAGEDGIILSDFRSPVDPACGTTVTPIARPDFLQFDEGDGATAQQDFQDRFACYADVGGGGCGYEQQLEAVLKALAGSRADAEPLTFVGGYGAPDSSGNSVVGGPNEGFVRPNSLLSIVMVTDEDDCSGNEASLYVNGGAFQSATAAEVWNDWGALRWSDPMNYTGEINTVAEAGAIDAADPDAPRDLQLRCFVYTQFLYATQRYIDGILDLRDPTASDLIVFAAITGVDQQVVEAARAQEDDEGGMNEFAFILADSSMDETVDYEYRDLRQYTTMPTAGAALDRPKPACTSYSATWTTTEFTEPSTLGAPCDTTAECVANMAPRDARVPPIECNLGAPSGGMAGTCHQAGAAAPARRIIEVAQGIEAGGGGAVVESICQDDFSGALNQIINKLADVLNRACLPEPLNPDSSGAVNCEVVEYLPTSGEYTTCQQVADAGLGRDAEPVRIEDGREVCRIQQIAISAADRAMGTVPSDAIPGWYYDDFTTGPESAQDLCTNPDNGTYQRIAFTELGKPVSGASVRLECLQPAVGGTVDDAEVATPCSFTTAELDTPPDSDARICQGEVAASQPEGMICDSLSNTCQFSCITSADCPGGFVCYTREEFNPDPTGRTACTVAGDCTNPGFTTCGTAGFCLSDAEAASTRSFCANPTCDTTGVGGA